MRPLLRLGWSVVFVAAVHPAAAGILAQAVPVKFNLTARPGQSLGRDVAVRNLGDAAVVVHVRLPFLIGVIGLAVVFAILLG